MITMIVLLIPGGCLIPEDPGLTDHADYLKAHHSWRENRLEYLKGADGWLNLAGLFWLDEGANTAGSDPENDVVIPEPLPPYLGTFTLYDGTVEFRAPAGSEVTHKGTPIREIQMVPDTEGAPTILAYKHYNWHVINRGNRFGIRLRNLEHPAIHELDSIPCFPPNLDWRIPATLYPLEESYNIKINNVLGQVEIHSVPGVLEFTIGKTLYALYPLGTPPDLWVVFADSTSAFETYGGGRFLELEYGQDDHMYIIDFNRAYNPPCAFTPFATCPLPPRENIMDIEIKAGEKKPGLHFHH